MLASFMIAKFVTDWVITNLYPKHKGLYFMKNKTFDSVDFSDAKDGLEVIKRERDQLIIEKEHDHQTDFD